MPIVYEVPTHLNVSDTILFGFQPRQLLGLVVAGSLAYFVWDRADTLPPEARIVIAGPLAAAGLACALLQPGGRPLDRWALAVLAYGSVGHRWRAGHRAPHHHLRQRLTDRPSTVATLEHALREFIAWLYKLEPRVKTFAAVTRDHLLAYGDFLANIRSSRTDRPYAFFSRRGRMAALAVSFRQIAHWHWEDVPELRQIRYGL